MRLLFLLVLFMSAILHGFEIQGHRGSRGTAPENSLPGFFEALDGGANGAELDLVVTKDGEIVIHHDLFIQKKLILSLNLSEIKAIDIGAIPNPIFPKQKAIPATFVPTLGELLEALLLHPKGSDFCLNLEIKRKSAHPNWSLSAQELAEKIMREVSTYGFETRVAYSSFDPEVLIAIRNINQDAKIGFINERSLKETKEIALKLKANIVSPEHKFLKTKQDVDELHKLGFKVIPWTVNDADRALELIEMGVDGIITDYPSDMVDLLKIKKAFNELGITISSSFRRNIK